MEEDRCRRDAVGYIGPDMYGDPWSASRGSLSVVEVDEAAEATEDVR